MIRLGQMTCRLLGHPLIRSGSIYGACHRCGALVRPRPKLPPVLIWAKRILRSDK